MSAIEQIREECRIISDLSHSSSLLSWDQQTYMPPKGADARARQLSTLSSVIHEKITAEKLGDLINAAQEEALDDDSTALLRELKWQRSRALKLPPELVRELSLETGKAFSAWNKARTQSDFQLFAPSLKKLVELSRQSAECFGYEEHPWDALAQDYERGVTARQSVEFFQPLRDAAARLLRQIAECEGPSEDLLKRRTPIEQQREFALRAARDFGYDMAAGRLDTTPHPFCSNFSVHDVRITTRYDMNRPLEAFGCVVHETGHALYEQGFRPEDEGSPLCAAPGHGIHESQSRFWEIQVAKSLPFWLGYFPVLQQYFPGVFDDLDPQTFYRAFNVVKPGFIRVEADEVSYNLHIIIRFELELALMGGELSVDDLPAEWNRRYKELLGLDVPNDALGCLQDIHWSYAAFGYFPSYTYGNIYGAMLSEAMRRDLPDLDQRIEARDFPPVLEWLRQHVHRIGKLKTAREIIEQATGRELSVQPLIAHLETKYADIYGFSS